MRAAEGWDHTKRSSRACGDGVGSVVSTMQTLVPRGSFLGPQGSQVALCGSLGGEGCTGLRHAGRGEGTPRNALGEPCRAVCRERL